ncbi:MAG: hypothetical protein HKP49_04355, partial [Maribacter sp.]|nr:hypothetical protein [Maribacter sp.]
LKDGIFKTTEQLFGQENVSLEIKEGIGRMTIEIEPLESFIFKIQ